MFLEGLDESYTEEAYSRMRYFSGLLKGVLGDDWFDFRIDGGFPRDAMESLVDDVDLWICHTAGFNRTNAAHFLLRGIESWFYGPMIYEQRRNSGCGSNTFTDLDLLTCRGVGWVAWKYDAGYCEWEFDWNAGAAWYEAENFKHPHRIYNGSGLLLYRGDVMACDQPIPSIRLKAQRRGNQDYEYFWLLTEALGDRTRADALVNSIVHGEPFGPQSVGNIEIWRNDPEEWDRVRVRIGERLHGEIR